MAQKEVRNPVSAGANGANGAVVVPQQKMYTGRVADRRLNNNTGDADATSGNDGDAVAAPLPFTGKNADGTWGPHGLYCGRIAESRLISVLRAGIRPKRLERIERILMNRCKRVTCVFENLSDPQNGAACLRTIESFGLSSSHTIEAYESFRISESVSKSAHKWIENHRYRHCHDAVEKLRADGYTIVATCLDSDATPLSQVDFINMPKIALCFGNEERGISKALRDRADHKVYIEMMGFTESFNISVSAALIMMHLRNLNIIQPDLDDHELSATYKKWLLMSTKKAVTLLKRHGLQDEAQDYV